MIPASSNPLHIRFGEFELDEANARLLRGGNPVPLAPTPFAVLCALARQPGSLLTKTALLDQVWGHRFVSDSVLKTAISDLRTVLGDDPRQPRYIETAARRGYRFIATTMEQPVAAPSSAEDLFLPGGASTDGAPSKGFVGRSKELARLRQAWDRANRGKPAIVWIAGEPGIGKTTLIGQFVAGLGDVAFARGQCVEHYGTSEPYLPILEALGQLARADDSVAGLLSAVAPTWLLQLPWLGTQERRESLQHELVGVSPDRMLREMGELLDRYTGTRPLLLVTEDLHWADRATIRLLDYMARHRGGARFMWLASFRLTEVVVSNEPLNVLRHELRIQGLCEEVVLDPFSESEIAAYLADRSPAAAGDENFVRALYERTDGVPLFVASVTNDVIARAAERNDADAGAPSLADLPIPEDLTAIIDHYVHRLDDERRSLLTAAAVCGLDFHVETLASVVERDASRVAELCDQLVREHRWLVAPRERRKNGAYEKPYAFRHALFREVLYERTTPVTRAELHRRVGAMLDEARAAGAAVTAAELAMHFDRGRAPMAALRFYAEGAEAALLNLRPAQCVSLTERALALLEHAPAGAERTSLEITLATLHGFAAFQVFGAGHETKVALQRASRLLAEDQTHPMRGLTLHGLGLLLTVRGEFADALSAAELAEGLAARTGDPSLPLAACAVRGHVYLHQGRPRLAREALERALETMDAADTGPGRRFIVDPCVTVLAMLSLALMHLGYVKQAHARLHQAYERARQLGQPMALVVAAWFDALLQVRLGNVDRVATIADQMSATVDKFSVTQGNAACRWFRGWVDARKGNPREGSRQILDAHEKNIGLGMFAGASENLGYAAEALLVAGDLSGAQEQLDRALQLVEKYGERIYLTHLLLIEGGIARARGKPDASEAAIRRAVLEAREQGAAWLELAALTELCESGGATDDDRMALAALSDKLDEAGGAAVYTRARAALAPA